MVNDEIPSYDRRIDLSGLVKLSGGDKAIELKYINNFLLSLPEQLNTIERALDEGDANILCSTLHLLKPQMQFYGLKDVFVEIKCAEEQLQQNKEISPAVREICDLIYKEIKFVCAEFELIKSNYI